MLVEADVRRIERIVRNLVVNAIEYGEGRDVEVRVAANSQAAALTVRDHGIGLKAGEDVLVFNRFWRADPARARTRGGTGLGLSIAVEDTALHGGRLEAWGRPREGSVFRLTLPLRIGGEFELSPLPLDAHQVTRSRRRTRLHPAAARRRPGTAMSRGRTRRTLVLVLVGLTAVGCVSIPDDSSVRQADDVGVADQSPPLTNVVTGPVAGAEPDEVVAGFYAAMLAYPQTMDKAREFLTPNAATRWDPDAELTVYDDPRISSFERDGGKTVIATVNASVSGTLNDRGSWTSADPDLTGIATGLKLRQFDGEWRITNPQDGTFVDQDFFNRFYERFSLYFFDPSLTVLTPDPVYLAVGDTAATSLVTDLLAGPTGNLRTAVTSAVPDGTKLDVAVSVSSDGDAEVPLTANVLKLSASNRQLFAAQLAWTLRQIETIKRISISVDGSNLDIENTESPFAVADSFSGFDPAGLSGERRLFVLQENCETDNAPADCLANANAGQVSPVLGPIVGVDDGVSVAVQTSGQLAAVVRDEGRSIAVGAVSASPDQGVMTWFTGIDLLRPSWDALDVLWVVDRTAAGSEIFTVDADGAHRVRAPDLAGLSIVAFAVSRDGVRFAAIVERNGARSLIVSTIDRQPDDPTDAQVLAPRTIASAGANLTWYADLAWVSPTSLAVLARETGDELQPYEIAIDGSDTEAMGGFLPGRLTSIAAGPSPDLPVAVGTNNGQVLQQTADSLWLPLRADGRLTAPAYPG